MKKFKIFVFLSLITLHLSLITPVFAAGATLSLSPSSGTFNTGCNVSLDINLDTGAAQTDGTDAILFYDPTRFTATSIKNGTIYSDYPGNNIDTQAGKIVISGLSSVSTPFKGQGVLATINFTVLSTAPEGATQITFDFDTNNKAKTTDSNVVERDTVADTLNQVTNGNYTIGTGECGAALTTTPTITPFQGSKGGLTNPIPTKTIDDFAGGGKTAGLSTPTLVVAGVGGIFIILGILGLVLL